MKSLIKLLILIVVLEIILGYALYLRNSPRMTGNYISSTLYVLDKLKPDKKIKEQKGKFGAERRKLEEAEERRKLEEAEENRKLVEAEEKRKLAEAEERRKLEESEENVDHGIKFDNTNVVSVEENDAGLTARNVIDMNGTEVIGDNFGSESEDRDALPGRN